MYRAIATIEGIAPLSQSYQHRTPELEGESKEDYEQRTWREKCNTDSDGNVVVPAMAFKQAMDAAAKRLAIPDPDNRKATFTKYFVSDVICEAHMATGVKKDEIAFITINANVDGVRGSGKRVPRTFPQTPKWGGTVPFMVMEEKIKPEIFERVLKAAGASIGVGQFRPEKGGLNGRWVVKGVKYERI